MLICVRSFLSQVHGAWTQTWDGHSKEVTEKLAELSKMISTFESSKMNIQAQMDTLAEAMSYALDYMLVPLVSFIMDAGLDKSVLLEHPVQVVTTNDPLLAGPFCESASSQSQAPDHEACYNDTGNHSAQLTLMDYACFQSKGQMGISSEYHNLIEHLLARGCLKPGDFASHVRALKNLGAGMWPTCVSPEEIRRGAEIICAHLSSTPQGKEKPRMPFDLLYICFDRGQEELLGELTKWFHLTNAGYSKSELRSLLLALTQENDIFFTRYKCLKYLYQADGDGYILQHDNTLEALCKANLLYSNGGGVEPILDYLNRGGKPTFMFTNGLSALFIACKNKCPEMAEKLLDLGADPNQYTSTRENYDKHDARSVWDGGDVAQVALMRLLLQRGANPFRRGGEDPGLGFPFEICMDGAELRQVFYPELFRELCRSSINDKTDDADLFDVLELACACGRYKYIQEMRAYAQTRVDTAIRENAALFLQKLLLNLSPLSELGGEGADFRTVLRMDEAMDTIQFILQLGPSGTLTSSWRLTKGEKDWTPLKLCKTLLANPVNPHLVAHAHCQTADIRRYRFHWCLSQRMVYISDPDEQPAIAILNDRITWPSQWNIETEWAYWDPEDAWTLAYIPSPWGCLCEPPYEPEW